MKGLTHPDSGTNDELEAIRARIKQGTGRSSIRYRGFVIAEKTDFGGSGHFIEGFYVRHGYVVIDKNGCNALPGAAWDQTVHDAKLSIDDLHRSKGDAHRWWGLTRARQARNMPVGDREHERELHRIATGGRR